MVTFWIMVTLNVYAILVYELKGEITVHSCDKTPQWHAPTFGTLVLLGGVLIELMPK